MSLCHHHHQLHLETFFTPVLLITTHCTMSILARSLFSGSEPPFLLLLASDIKNHNSKSPVFWSFLLCNISHPFTCYGLCFLLSHLSKEIKLIYKVWCNLTVLHAQPLQSSPVDPFLPCKDDWERSWKGQGSTYCVDVWIGFLRAG